jgi:DNA-3-methyladenine glycosylase
MLCQAIAVTKMLDGLDLITSSDVVILRGRKVAPDDIQSGPRIGISRAKELALRFYLRGNRFVSRHSYPKAFRL